MGIIKLKAGNEVFDVELEVAKKSITIKTMLEDLGGQNGEEEEEDDVPVPLQNVTGPVFKKVLEWCTYHKDDPPVVEDENAEKRSDDIIPWDKEFIDKLDDQKMLIDIILAANYLDIKGLLDLGCKTIANMCKGKNPDEIRKTFNIAPAAKKDDGAEADKVDEKETEGKSVVEAEPPAVTTGDK